MDSPNVWLPKKFQFVTDNPAPNVIKEKKSGSKFPNDFVEKYKEVYRYIKDKKYATSNEDGGIKVELALIGMKFQELQNLLKNYVIKKTKLPSKE